MSAHTIDDHVWHEWSIDAARDLHAIANRYVYATDGQRQARENLHRAIRTAYRAGMSCSRISECVGLSRQRIYQICDLSKDGGK